MGQIVAAKAESFQGWVTPPEILELVRAVGPIGLDPCTSSGNPTDAVCGCVGSREALAWYGDDLRLSTNDGLGIDWRAEAHDLEEWGHSTLIYVNPPWKEAARWVAKCAAEAAKGCEIIYLGPAATDAKYFHELILPTAERVCLWRGRVAFLDPRTGKRGDRPTGGVMLAYWGPNGDRFEEVFGPRGAVW